MRVRLIMGDWEAESEEIGIADKNSQHDEASAHMVLYRIHAFVIRALYAYARRALKMERDAVYDTLRRPAC